MSTHTPGPWRSSRQVDYCLIETDAENIAHVYGSSLAHIEANARLVAAAPELYAALSGLVHEICELDAYERFAPFVDAAEDALAKAKGR